MECQTYFLAKIRKKYSEYSLQHIFTHEVVTDNYDS